MQALAVVASVQRQRGNLPSEHYSLPVGLRAGCQSRFRRVRKARILKGVRRPVLDRNSFIAGHFRLPSCIQ